MKTSDQKNNDRKRGRPSGRGRVPLSIEERRARNAQYERERRVETAEAMSELAATLGCGPSASNADILSTALEELHKFSNRDPSEDILELRRCNTKLMQQIEDIERRLTSFENRQGSPKKENLRLEILKRKEKPKKRKVKSVKHSLDQHERPTEPGFSIKQEPLTANGTTFKTEPSEPTQEPPLQLDSINECPVEWSLENLIAGYML